MRILDYQAIQEFVFAYHKLMGQVRDAQDVPSQYGRDGFGHGMVEVLVQHCHLVENSLSATLVASYCMDSPIYGGPHTDSQNSWKPY